MAHRISKATLLADLQERMRRHVLLVTTRFASLAIPELNRQPAPGEWSVLQCFDHLNLTHDYYYARMAPALAHAAPAAASDDYRPSFWARIYMHFAFNPRYSFPTAPEITPGATLQRTVLADYLANQGRLQQLFTTVAPLDLRRTPVSIERGVSFNLGDCLKILVYHDGLHVAQAARVIE